MKKATATMAALNAATATKAAKSDAVSLLKADHRKVEQLFAQFEATDEESGKQTLVRQICTELIVHTKLEEEIFYPACREKQVEDDLMDEAQVEHDGAKVLIGDLLSAKPGDDFYDAKVKTLSEYIKHHVGEEEMPRTGIFAKAQKAGVDMAGLGQKLQARKAELMGKGEALISQPPQPRSFKLSPQSQESSSMASRYSNDRDRDDRGRFTSDDDNRGGYQSRGGGNRDRDEQGRFTGDDDNRGGYQSRGGRFNDDDNRGSRSGEGRGWYGDSRGHSQAARDGWDDRGASRSSRSRDDDDERDGYRSRSGNRDRDEQGRFTSDDDRGGSQLRGRSSHDDDERGSRSGGEGRGWFGDSRGHSQAAREGWEDRGSSRSSRGRDDDDDRGGRSGGRGGSQGGHGGWFGDPEGHSRAAREGWRDR
jgi:hypothetical protein